MTVFGAIEAVRKRHAKVTVLGVESPLLKSLYPKLPRIQAPIEELGRRMTGALVQLLKNGDAESMSPQVLYAKIIDEEGNVFNEDTSL